MGCGWNSTSPAIKGCCVSQHISFRRASETTASTPRKRWEGAADPCTIDSKVLTTCALVFSAFGPERWTLLSSPPWPLPSSSVREKAAFPGRIPASPTLRPATRRTLDKNPWRNTTNLSTGTFSKRNLTEAISHNGSGNNWNEVRSFNAVCCNNSASGYRYLKKNGLCGRAPVQSFIQATKDQVVQVCGTKGSRVVGGGNLCISKSTMKIYHVESECFVKNVNVHHHKVVLACDKVGRKCLPVHYEKCEGHTAGDENCSNNRPINGWKHRIRRLCSQAKLRFRPTATAVSWNTGRIIVTFEPSLSWSHLVLLELCCIRAHFAFRS